MSDKPVWEKNTEVPFLGSIPNMWIIIAVAIVFFTGAGAGLRARAGLPSGWDLIDSLSGVAEESVSGTPFYGTFEVNVNKQDTLTKATATPTSDSYALFLEDPQQDSDATVVSGATDFTIYKENAGIFYMVVDSGTDFFEYIDRIVSQPSVVSYAIRDYDGDSDLDLILEVDISGIAPPNPDYKPEYTINMPLIDEDVALSIDSPSDQTGIGETEVVKNIEWTISGFGENDGCFIGEIKFTTNSTEEGDDVTLEELYVGGQVTYNGKKIFTTPIRDSYGDYVGWYVEADDKGDHLSDGAVLAYRENNRADTLTLSLNVRCNFETNDTVAITCSVTPIDADQSKGTAVTDLVNLDEA